MPQNPTNSLDLASEGSGQSGAPGSVSAAIAGQGPLDSPGLGRPGRPGSPEDRYPEIYEHQRADRARLAQSRPAAPERFAAPPGYLEYTPNLESLDPPEELYSLNPRPTTKRGHGLVRGTHQDTASGASGASEVPQDLSGDGGASGGCGGYWTMRHCGCESQPVYRDGCGRRSCPICGYQKSKGSAGRVLARLVEAPDDRFQFLVLTVPVELRRRYMDNGDGRKLWTKHLREFVTWAKNGPICLKYAYLRTHPAGDDGRYFSPHANLIFAQDRDAKGYRAGKLDVDAIRDAWAGIIGYDGKPDIHAQYVDARDIEGRKALAHHVRYIERHFPGWSWDGQKGRWYGQYPPKPEPLEDEGPGCCCPICHERYWYADPEGEEILAVGVLRTYLESGQPPPKWLELAGVPRVPERPAGAARKVTLQTGHLWREGRHEESKFSFEAAVWFSR